MKSKYVSRKFIVTVIAAVAGIITAVIEHDELVQSVAACATVVLPTIVYTITEGRIDAAGVRSSGEAVEKTLRDVGEDRAAEVVRNLTNVAEAATEAALQDEPH